MSKHQITWPAPKGTGSHAAKRPSLIAEFLACAKQTPTYAALLIISILLPTLFMGALLFTSLDPQGNMHNVPAVVVNSDKGATINGEERNIGQELSDRLINGNAHVQEGTIAGFDWAFESSLGKAKDGLDRGDYYVMVVVPEDFSEAIATSPGKNAKQAQIDAVFNPSLAYGVQQFGYSFLQDVTSDLAKDLQKEKADDVFVRLKTASTDFLTLTNAGLDLSDGLTTAADGSEQLADGVSQLASGLLQLKDGIDNASSSPESVALANALSDLGNALQRFGDVALSDPNEAQAALDDAERAARAAAQANSTLGNPLVAYVCGGSFTYGNGDTKVTANEKGLVPSIKKLYEAESRFGDALTKLKPALETLGEISEKIRKASSEQEIILILIENRETLLALLGPEEIKAVTDLIDFAQNELTPAAVEAFRAVGKCEGYLVGVAVTSDYMQGSTAQLSEALGTIHSAVAGTAGGDSLLSGVDSLHDGLNTAADTSGELFDSMGEAQNDIKDATQNSDTQSTVLAGPVALNAEGLVSTLGANVSPYYLFVGLWAGCMISALVLSRLCKRRRPLMLTLGEVASVTAANVAPLIAVTVIQVLLAQIVMHAAFGLQIDHVAVFYAMGLLAAVSFAAVIGTLVTLMGMGGIVAAFVLLALQLALASSLFPVQASLLPILNIGNMILPLSQAVAGLRIAMRGSSIAMLLLPVVVLAIFAVVAFAGQAVANALSVRPAGKHAQGVVAQESAEADSAHA